MDCAKTYPVLFSNAFVGAATSGFLSALKWMEMCGGDEPNRAQDFRPVIPTHDSIRSNSKKNAMHLPYVKCKTTINK
jgi:hypothetical protein